MPSHPDDATIPEQIRFRPSAKRKAYRRRAADQDTTTTTTTDSQTPSLLATTHDAPSSSHASNGAETAHHQTDDQVEEEEGGEDHQDTASEAAVLAALRARTSRKARLQGVGFRSNATDADRTAGASGSMALHRYHEDQDMEDVNPLATIAGRFTHQTGLLNDVDDRHMTEYIESRLSSRPAQAPQYPDELEASHHGQGQAPARNGPERPIIQGKIVEVEIHDERGTNPTNQRGSAPPPKKQRLGPDGKPWRPRNRRGSDDVKRDQLVEEFLHENRLDVYEVPKQLTSGGDGDGDGDKRLADEFRRQYMDDVAKRRQLRKKKPVQPPKPRSENVLRGPKLGGSRNSRAAVRNALLQEKKDAKK